MQMIRCMVGNGSMSWMSRAAERCGDAAFELGVVLLAEALVDGDDLAVRAHQYRARHRLDAELLRSGAAAVEAELEVRRHLREEGLGVRPLRIEVDRDDAQSLRAELRL